MKLIYLFILPLLAGATICAALHTFIPFTGIVGPDYLSQSGTHFIFGLLGFLFGFLPMFIRSLAIHTLKAMKPHQQPVREIETPVLSLFVGQEFNSIASNCRMRVKALHGAIFANADFSEHEYVLNFSL